MSLKIALAQLNLTVGDIHGNCQKIAGCARHAKAQLGADLLLCPELSVTGYPPEDLLLRPDFVASANAAVLALAAGLPAGLAVVVGCPEPGADGRLFNAAAVLGDGRVMARYHKRALPNYGVFDERRYFSAGDGACVFSLQGVRLGLAICEDVWSPEVLADNKRGGAELALVMNASPFHGGKIHQRQAVVADQARALRLPVVYLNLVGGQDELVFDGASFAVDQAGEVVFRAREFEEQVGLVEYRQGRLQPGGRAPVYQEVASEYQALVLGIRDYVGKNRFPGALVGLSGGVDSALVLALAADALGADKVTAVLMPSRHTRPISVEDAISQANALGVRHHLLPIEPAVVAFTGLLAPLFAGLAQDSTEENLQSRCRGVLLMALSNKFGGLLLTTGNKSEMGVGYATLYGDMAGGFAPIKDVPKLMVYKLARHRNRLSPVIPERVLTRPPSAELAPEQRDDDSLPPYDQLDPILERYVEQDLSAAQIIAAGFNPEHVLKAIRLVDRSEHKRRQSPPGIKITARAYGRDRRYPVTSGYRGDLP